ncbi:hypothetical protein BKA70DRAFT_1569919 [Coprinopsis sp. MPI-PUGE-AT-0042]|nr:hypothetical protein BKA70DRAFT_1569919 [Coprinopsis sp. MPI-PUGE-AT-0042]
MFSSAHIIISFIAILSIFPSVIATAQHEQRGIVNVHRKHMAVVEPRGAEAPSNSTHELEKRQRRFGHFSWYNTEESGNPGNCGDHIKNYEFVVAKYLPEFSMADCGMQIRIFYHGKEAVATVKDSCGGCSPGGFDMSRGLFEFFEADAVRVGTIDTEWEWVGAEQPQPPPPPPPTTTEQPWTPPPTPSSTSVWQAPSSSSVHPSSVSRPAPSSANPSARASGSDSVSGTARPTSTPVDSSTTPQNWQALSGVMVKMAFLITDAPDIDAA